MELRDKAMHVRSENNGFIHFLCNFGHPNLLSLCSSFHPGQNVKSRVASESSSGPSRGTVSGSETLKDQMNWQTIYPVACAANK